MFPKESDVLKLFKTKEFKAHLKKDKVKLVEDNFKKLQLQLNQKNKKNSISCSRCVTTMFKDFKVLCTIGLIWNYQTGVML